MRHQNRSEKKKSKLLYRIIFLIALCVFAYSGFELFKIYKANYDEANERNRVASLGKIDPSKPFAVDFASLQEVNPDIIGWIIIPGTEISYPILKGSDNEYYLNHTFEKQENYAGSIFVDYRQAADFSDPNTFVYGHNVFHGTMFAELEKFKDPQFYEEHPYFFVYTPNGNYRADIMSMYSTMAYSESYKIGFTHSEFFMDYVNMVKGLAEVPRVVPFEKEDTMITLSTCSYEQGGVASDARYLLHAKLTPWTGDYIPSTEEIID